MEANNDLIATIERISVDGASPKEYECLVALLADLQPTELKMVVKTCDIIKLFSSMNLQERKQMDIAIRLAGILFSAIPLKELLKNHQSEILQALQSPRDDLVEFVLRKLNDGLNSVDDFDSIPRCILDSTVTLVASDCLAVSQAASKFLSTMAAHIPNATSILFNSDFVEQSHHLSCSSEKTLRFIEMVIDVLKVDPSSLTHVTSQGLLEPLLKGLSAHDPLTNLNFVEVTKELLHIPGGYEWLSRHDILNKLMLRLGDIENDSVEKVLIPGYLSLIGCTVRFHPEQLSNSGESRSSHTILRMLISASNNPDPTISLAGIESISYIAGSAGGRSALSALLAPGGALSPALRKLGRLLEDSPSFVCVRALNSVVGLVEHIDTERDGPDLDQAMWTLSWLSVVGGLLEPTHANNELATSVAKVLSRLLSLASNPYTDVRSEALKALAAVASQPWGLRSMINRPGCMEYLLNRRTEVGIMEATQLMQAKYKIIQNILNTLDRYKTCSDRRFSILLSSELLIRLKAYAREGIWGVQSSQATIAMEPG